MKNWVKENIVSVAWGVFAFANILAVWGWSQLGTDVSNLYRLFPLFGLIAFSTMWGHYVVWALREWSGADSDKTTAYSKITQWIVLGAILLHPTLLVYQLKADGLGLPPESYKAYVGESLFVFVILGTLCLFIFLAFEFKKYLSKKPNLWKTVLALNHIAMLGIVVHALMLGNSVKQVPLMFVWPIYGISLIGIYIYLASKQKLV